MSETINNSQLTIEEQSVSVLIHQETEYRYTAIRVLDSDLDSLINALRRVRDRRRRAEARNQQKARYA